MFEPNWSYLEDTLDDKHCFVSSLVLMLSRVQLFVTTLDYSQAPLSMGFFRQENWSGLPLSPPEDLPDPGIKPTSPMSPALQASSLPAEPPVNLGTCQLPSGSALSVDYSKCSV